MNTGEVVANDDPRADQKLATGDAVNVAARLEQAAPENEIYIGEITYRLVRDAVEVEPVEPLELKGKARAGAGVAVRIARGMDGMSRRERHADRRPRRGVGSHRCAPIRRCAKAHRASRHGDRRCRRRQDAPGARSRGPHRLSARACFAGRCLPYGDGITFWPLLGWSRRRPTSATNDSPEQAREKLRAAVGDAEVADAPAPAPVWPERGHLPAARDQLGGAQVPRAPRRPTTPVVALVDDIHWAETGVSGAARARARRVHRTRRSCCSPQRATS